MEITWKPSMTVGEAAIDNQHKRLLEQINRLVHTLSSLDIEINQLRDSIHFLFTYIEEHFSYEETYMLKNGYPGIEGHKKLHRGFIDFYQGFQKKLMDRGSAKNFSSVDIRELMEEEKKFLASWLVNHIQTADRGYARYINARSKARAKK